MPNAPWDAQAQLERPLTYREMRVCVWGRICWCKRFNVFWHRHYSWKDKGHSPEWWDVTSGSWLRLQKCNWKPTDTILKSKNKKRRKLSPVPYSVDIFFKPCVCVCVIAPGDRLSNEMEQRNISIFSPVSFTEKQGVLWMASYLSHCLFSCAACLGELQ